MITVSGIVLLLFSWYNNYQFDNNPLNIEIRQQIAQKEYKVKKLIKHYYSLNLNIPLIVTDKMNSRLFGLTTYNSKKNQIRIFLNKKRFKENLDYMIEDVIPHEYAHAVIFRLGDFSNKNSGHTLKWQKACIKLEGKRCDRFVNHKDILIDKTKFF